MTAVLLLHHPDDALEAERLATDLADQLSAIRCRVALPTEEARLQGAPVPAFEPGGVMLFALTPHFRSTNWFEYLDRVCPSPLDPVLISVLLQEAPIPRLLQDKAAVDLREGEPRAAGLNLLHDLLRTPRALEAVPQTVCDPAAEERGLIGSYYLRPKVWYCVDCGTKGEGEGNDVLCRRCGKHRPFAGGSCTMIQCHSCTNFSIASASYCEWCGRSL